MNDKPISAARKKTVLLLTLISELIIIVYVLYYCVRLGIPDSISASYFNLKHRIWFPLTIWLSGLTIIYPISVIGSKISKIAGYCLVMGLILIGLAPNFENIHEHPVHIIGAGIAILSASVWVYLNYRKLLWMWIIFVVYEIALLLSGGEFPGKTLFVAETITIIIFYTSVFKKIFSYPIANNKCNIQ